MTSVEVRGSRKHVLDWVEQLRFLPELLQLVRPVECQVTADSVWQPIGYRDPTEARLDVFGPGALPHSDAWAAISPWWLKHSRGANTPNWDIALSCSVEGKPGLILVEAKANVPELSEAGKRLGSDSSPRSKENHEQIAAAIAEAASGLQPFLPGLSIDIDQHYQLANRLAFSWRLASLGIPVVLLYLGFTGDTGISNVGDPFADDLHWQETVKRHVGEICPVPLFDREIKVGPASMWVLARSRPVLQKSTSRSPGETPRRPPKLPHLWPPQTPPPTDG